MISWWRTFSYRSSFERKNLTQQASMTGLETLHNIQDWKRINCMTWRERRLILFSPVPMLRRRLRHPPAAIHLMLHAHGPYRMLLFLQNRPVTGPVAVVGGALKSTLWSRCLQFRSRWPDYENRDAPLWRINSLCSVSSFGPFWVCRWMHSFSYSWMQQSVLVDLTLKALF